jgi:dimethylargininase
MEAPTTTGYGCRDMTGTLLRVLVRAPTAGETGTWEACRWRAAPDPSRLASEHERFRKILEQAGAEVVLAGREGTGSLDAVYAFDPALVTENGAILLRPGKEVRADEPAALQSSLRDAGVPIAGAIEAPATVDGGDLLRLDERTLLAGIGYRTNSAGVESLAALLPGVEVVAFDLPHLHGAGEVLHLLSLLSPLDRDLAVAYLPLMPVRLVQLLGARGIELVEVPHEEFETMGPNVLALGPRLALAVDGNPGTRKRMEKAGVTVLTYRGDELSKGDGGPTCLTLPLLRD